MKKELIVKMVEEGKTIVLEGNFTNGEETWTREEWSFDGTYFNYTLDGYDDNFRVTTETIEDEFNPEEAEEIEVA